MNNKIRKRVILILLIIIGVCSYGVIRADAVTVSMGNRYYFKDYCINSFKYSSGTWAFTSI